ncbi:hybrid sensor histidine kinase/response regulator [Cyanobacteria bacterium FACHB-63]|nr:hybrid sensor histidine kinase/response regulator [Cyanobacteria bacterium FACHB-63]
MRTSLNPILGWSSLLQKGRLSPKRTTKALQTIERNVKLQAQLIDDLLDISRILQGKLSLNAFPIDLSFVISAALETVRLAIEAKASQLNPCLDPGVKQVRGDTARLQQVVWNLLSNAAKFTPAGGQIDLTLTQVGSMVQLQVKDNGKGIHPDFLPHAFEHFRQQEDGTTTRQFGGLGLGLAIAKRIAEMHSGTIGVESRGEGQGATFTVQLPVATMSSPDQTSDAEDSEVALDGLQVLVVNDEADMRDLVDFILNQHGAIVRTAASAMEALTILEQFTPDPLISDVGMPETDGYTLI